MSKILILPLLVFVLISLVSIPITQSFASVSNNLTITGNGDTALMELKATKDGGKASGFRLTADNVLSISLNGQVDVLEDMDFTRALIDDKRVTISNDGIISFAGYSQGVYTLDVVVDDDRAYEVIVAVGPQTQQIINRELTEVNQRVDIDIIFDNDDGDNGSIDRIDLRRICSLNPDDSRCPDPVDGKCPNGWGMNDDEQCFPSGPCLDGYHRADDDESGRCIPEEDLQRCKSGGWVSIGEKCIYDDIPTPPTPTPTDYCYPMLVLPPKWDKECGHLGPWPGPAQTLAPTPPVTPIPEPTPTTPAPVSSIPTPTEPEPDPTPTPEPPTPSENMIQNEEPDEETTEEVPNEPTDEEEPEEEEEPQDGESGTEDSGEDGDGDGNGENNGVVDE